MSSEEIDPIGRLAVAGPIQRGFARHGALRLALLIAPHLAALAILVATEVNLVAATAFLLTWGFVNFLLLVVFRRPAVSAALSLALVVTLVLLSQLKQQALLMTANFVDVMVIDLDTFRFLLTIYSGLGRTIVLAAIPVLAALVVVWRLDRLRMHRLVAACGGLGCLVGLTGLSLAVPYHQWEAFFPDGYVSKFARSGAIAFSEWMTHGFLESDAVVSEELKNSGLAGCSAAGKRPHIVMVFDESSFDIRQAPGIKVPPGYGPHFRSFDGKARKFIVEGAGGPSWYTEYNVLTGLSARSFGRFAYFVTRIAAGRVERGLPNALRACGYKTYSFYPAFGAFLSARNFQTTTGIEHFKGALDLRARGVEPDSFFYNAALRTLAHERGEDPLFMFVYLAANHFPWDYRYRPELTPGWQPYGNAPHIDEYIRRQGLSVRDYQSFVSTLKRDYPNEPFLIVRFGDHQPEFAAKIVEPGLSDAEIGRRILMDDEALFSTYYAIDTVNFRPHDLTDARDTLAAPYLPLVVLEAAGLSLDASFAEQKKIMQRCDGQFYLCRDGAEARRFNRLLINAGLIKGL